MREVIEALRTSAHSLRHLASCDQQQGEPGLARRDREIAAGRDRAADLLEALASPPETVEELRERATELLGEDFVAVDESTGMALDVRVVTGMVQGMGTGGLVSVSAFDPRVPSIEVRAAWFAIVALTQEVERG